MRRDPWFRIAKNITLFTQVGISIATPLVLCIWGAVWLRDRFGLGSWIVLVGVLVGIAGAMGSFMNFAAYASKEVARKDGDERPDHDHQSGKGGDGV